MWERKLYFFYLGKQMRFVRKHIDMFILFIGSVLLPYYLYFKKSYETFFYVSYSTRYLLDVLVPARNVVVLENDVYLYDEKA